MRTLLLVVAIASCHPAQTGYTTRGNPTVTQAPTSSSGGTSAAEASAETGATLAPAEHARPDTATPSSAPCMYDPASGRYAVCDHVTNDGLCASFGAACGAAELGGSGAVAPCMFDGGTGRYARCSSVTNDGRCAAYGPWCGPDDLRPRGGGTPCMFDPSDGHLKTCNHVTTDGKCAAYGGWCQP
jgi:hypothetical protein